MMPKDTSATRTRRDTVHKDIRAMTEAFDGWHAELKGIVERLSNRDARDEIRDMVARVDDKLTRLRDEVRDIQEQRNVERGRQEVRDKLSTRLWGMIIAGGGSVIAAIAFAVWQMFKAQE